MSVIRSELKAELVELVKAYWANGVYETEHIARETGRSQQWIRVLIVELKLVRPRKTWDEHLKTLPAELVSRASLFRKRLRNRKSLP